MTSPEHTPKHFAESDPSPSDKAIVRSARYLKEWVGVFGVAFVAFLLLRIFVVAPFTVPTGSMEPTIMVGDNVFAQKVTLNLGGHVETGDIVVFDNIDTSSEHSTLIKRVIATEGQTVEFEDGIVYVDGVALDEPYADGYTVELIPSPVAGNLTYPYTVPEGYVWVMGDNREDSLDSRYFGPIPEKNLIGVAFLRYWPLNRIGML